MSVETSFVSADNANSLILVARPQRIFCKVCTCCCRAHRGAAWSRRSRVSDSAPSKRCSSVDAVVPCRVAWKLAVSASYAGQSIFCCGLKATAQESSFSTHDQPWACWSNTSVPSLSERINAGSQQALLAPLTSHNAHTARADLVDVL